MACKKRQHTIRVGGRNAGFTLTIDSKVDGFGSFQSRIFFGANEGQDSINVFLENKGTILGDLQELVDVLSEHITMAKQHTKEEEA